MDGATLFYDAEDGDPKADLVDHHAAVMIKPVEGFVE